VDGISQVTAGRPVLERIREEAARRRWASRSAAAVVVGGLTRRDRRPVHLQRRDEGGGVARRLRERTAAAGTGHQSGFELPRHGPGDHSRQAVGTPWRGRSAIGRGWPCYTTPWRLRLRADAGRVRSRLDGPQAAGGTVTAPEMEGQPAAGQSDRWPRCPSGSRRHAYKDNARQAPTYRRVACCTAGRRPSALAVQRPGPETGGIGDAVNLAAKSAAT